MKTHFYTKSINNGKRRPVFWGCSRVGYLIARGFWDNHHRHPRTCKTKRQPNFFVVTTKVLDLSISFSPKQQVDKQLDKHQSSGYPNNGQNPVRNIRKQVSNDVTIYRYLFITNYVSDSQIKVKCITMHQSI